jgi:hypothetical protein
VIAISATTQQESNHFNSEQLTNTSWQEQLSTQEASEPETSGEMILIVSRPSPRHHADRIRDRPVHYRRIKPCGPSRCLPGTELATAGLRGMVQRGRPHTAVGSVPPAEYEAAYYARIQSQPEVEPSN